MASQEGPDGWQENASISCEVEPVPWHHTCRRCVDQVFMSARMAGSSRTTRSSIIVGQLTRPAECSADAPGRCAGPS